MSKMPYSLYNCMQAKSNLFFSPYHIYGKGDNEKDHQSNQELQKESRARNKDGRRPVGSADNADGCRSVFKKDQSSSSSSTSTRTQELFSGR